MNRDMFLKLNEEASKIITLAKLSLIGEFNVFNFLQCINIAKIYDKKEIKNILLCHTQDESLKKMVNSFEFLPEMIDPDEHKFFFKTKEIIEKLITKASHLKETNMDKLIKQDFFLRNQII